MASQNERTLTPDAATPGEELTKEQLQARMEKTREDLAQSVEEIKEVVGRQYDSVKETVTGVLDYRERFTEEPLVWSLGALSAGFALGYTLGYAHKNTKGSKRKQSQIAAFADSITRDLTTVGQNLIMPALNTQIKALFGFDFNQTLEEMGSKKVRGGRRVAARKTSTKGGAKKRTSKTKK